jgi:glucarate dehydratase
VGTIEQQLTAKQVSDEKPTHTPVITDMKVIPVAGHDSMLLNLSGAHGPFFTRNVIILKDNSGHTGVGEVPGGEAIRKTLEDAGPIVIGQSIGRYHTILNSVRKQFGDRDVPEGVFKHLICG